MARVLRCSLLAAPAWLVASSAAARFELAPTFPWTLSVNGAETASALAIDVNSRIHVAGTTWTPATLRDVLLAAWSLTQTAVPWSGTTTARPISSTSYDRASADEGPPALAVTSIPTGGPPAQNVADVYLAFTTTGTGSADATLLRVRGDAFGGYRTSSPYHEHLGADAEGLAAVAISGGGTPFSAGSLDANGTAQLLVFRHVRPTASADWVASPMPWPRVTATYWSGSSRPVRGRAVVIDSQDGSWVVAESQGDVWLFRYGSEAFQDSGSGDLRAIHAFVRRHAVGGADPAAAALDGAGRLWVAGAIGADAAVWRFDAAGNLTPGFPVRFNPGGGARFAAIALDDAGDAYVTGRAGGQLVFAGYGGDGTLRPGTPVLLSAGADAVEGNGLAFDREGAAWIAATVTAGGGTWGGTIIRLYRLLRFPDPPPVAPGEIRIRGPRGAVLDPARGEALPVLMLPSQPGEVRVRVLTLRGEVLREWRLAAAPGVPLSVAWDGRNAAGRIVATGTYAVVVSGAGLSAVRRAVVAPHR
jgi:hypothetical protein